MVVLSLIIVRESGPLGWGGVGCGKRGERVSNVDVVVVC